MRNRTIIGIICIIIAFLAFFLSLALIDGETEEELTTIVAAKKITAGKLIDEDDIEVIKVSGKNTGKTIVSSGFVIGRYAVSDIYPGDYFTLDKLRTTAGGAADDLANLGDGEFAVTVSISDPAGGFSAQLENGDVVRIYIESEDGGRVSPAQLQYVRVISTVTSKGEIRDGVKVGNQQDYELPASVMFAVNDEQAALLFSAEEISCAFVCHKSDARAEVLLAEQEAYFTAVHSSAISSSAASDNAGAR